MRTAIKDVGRDATRLYLAEAIFDWFVANGFEQTTVEEAARSAGISRATFFRYFRSKEDAVIAAVRSSELDFSGALKSLDSAVGVSTWTHLRQAFEAAVIATEADSARVRARALMITSVPTLAGQLHERRREQERMLMGALSEKLPDALTAKVVVAAAVSAFDLAWREWASGTEPSFRALLDEVFMKLKQSFE